MHFYSIAGNEVKVHLYIEKKSFIERVFFVLKTTWILKLYTALRVCWIDEVQIKNFNG